VFEIDGVKINMLLISATMGQVGFENSIYRSLLFLNEHDSLIFCFSLNLISCAASWEAIAIARDLMLVTGILGLPRFAMAWSREHSRLGRRTMS
jgi:hypothetical protein